MSKETLKIWKENRLDQEETLSFQEVIKKFKNSEYWENYIFTSMSLEEALTLLMASKNGLNCTYEKEEFQELLSFLKLKIKKQYLGE